MTKTKLDSRGFHHLFVAALIIIVGLAGFGTYRLISSSANSNAIYSLASSKGCWLAGRVWDAAQPADQNCTTSCRLPDHEYVIKDSARGIGYCDDHLVFSTTASICTNRLKRYYVSELAGCARKPLLTDGNAPDYCQAGDPYYDVNFNTPDDRTETRNDTCRPATAAPVTAPGAFTVGSYNILSTDFLVNSRNVGRCRDKKPNYSCAIERANRQETIIRGNADNPAFDIFGAQEVSPEQYNILKRKLNNYGVFPSTPQHLVHNEDGTTAIWWNKQKFTAFDRGKAPGLSNTLSQVSVPYVGLKDRRGHKFYVMSVHYASKSKGGNRRTLTETAELTLRFVRSKADAKTQVIIVGDMNDEPRDKRTYCTLTKSGLLQHASDAARKVKRSKNCPSPGSFKKDSIDHIYTTHVKGSSVSSWKQSNFEGIYARSSDHYPVYATFVRK